VVSEKDIASKILAEIKERKLIEELMLRTAGEGREFWK